MAWSRVHRERGRRRFAGPYGRNPRLPRVAGGAQEWIICRLDWHFTDDLLTITSIWLHRVEQRKRAARCLI
jgi:hypothetical protein